MSNMKMSKILNYVFNFYVLALFFKLFWAKVAVYFFEIVHNLISETPRNNVSTIPLIFFVNFIGCMHSWTLGNLHLFERIK